MKFMIRRTSLRDEEQPCKEVYKDEYVYVDERTVSNPAKIKQKGYPEKWYNEGRNHRVEKGHIKRDFVDTGWFVNIDSLEQLIKFQNKYGEIIVGEYCDGVPSIEIYDDYRE